MSSLAGFVLVIPLGYAAGAVLGLLEATPYHVLTFALELSWYFGIAIVLGWFLDEWLPPTAALSLLREHSSGPQFRGQAHGLQDVPISEDEDEPPVLSPPRKSLPAPEYDSTN